MSPPTLARSFHGELRRDRAGAMMCAGLPTSKSGRSCRLASQKTNPIRTKNISTVTETTCVAKPRVGVKASGEVSRMTP